MCNWSAMARKDDISMPVISSILSWKNGIISTVNNGFNPREELI